MASAEQMLDIHMYQRCYASLMEFLLQTKDQALQPTRIRFCHSDEKRQRHIRLVLRQAGSTVSRRRQQGYTNIACSRTDSPTSPGTREGGLRLGFRLLTSEPRRRGLFRGRRA